MQAFESYCLTLVSMDAVQITKDLKTSIIKMEIPIKPSIGGLKVRRFLSHPKREKKLIKKSHYVSRVNYGLWKIFHNAIKGYEVDGLARNVKADVWKSLEKLFIFCNKHNWSKKDHHSFEEDAKTCVKSMKKTWIACNITHYMVRNLLFILTSYPRFTIYTIKDYTIFYDDMYMKILIIYPDVLFNQQVIKQDNEWLLIIIIYTLRIIRISWFNSLSLHKPHSLQGH